MTLSITSLGELRTTIAGWRAAGQKITLVPTMGALHAGHLSLVKSAKAHGKVVVSIFVNPTQFGPNEDFTRYPRPLEADLALLDAEAVDTVWLPSVETMYPQGFSTVVSVKGISEVLEGTFRPGHFDGVATVVTKLFSQVVPDAAIFGEKDYQQLCLIERLVKDLNMNLSIIRGATARESDGLAMSSRNRYLSAEERKIAPKLAAIMNEAVNRMKKGEAVSQVLSESKAQLLKVGFRAVDYLELRAENTLVPLDAYQTPSRLLAAVHLGTTRLIDNIQVL